MKVQLSLFEGNRTPVFALKNLAKFFLALAPFFWKSNFQQRFRIVLEFFFVFYIILNRYVL